MSLNDSLIASVRDLGTALDNLGVLWMAKCCLSDLDGLSSIDVFITGEGHLKYMYKQSVEIGYLSGHVTE